MPAAQSRLDRTPTETRYSLCRERLRSRPHVDLASCEVVSFGGQPMTHPLIAVDNLSFSYGQDGPNPIQALDGVSLLIERGSYTAIIGHNGSGKSTLAKCLNGLLIPSDGSVVVDGMDTREPDHRYAVRALVGMVFQNPDNQFVATTVAEEAATNPFLRCDDPALAEAVDMPGAAPEEIFAHIRKRKDRFAF